MAAKGNTTLRAAGYNGWFKSLKGKSGIVKRQVLCHHLEASSLSFIRLTFLLVFLESVQPLRTQLAYLGTW